jgi:mono/diheme cytochrome c family protein
VSYAVPGTEKDLNRPGDKRCGPGALRWALAAALLITAAVVARADDAAVARGAYLAAAAGCEGCHTDSAGHGRPYAGGRAFRSVYGAIPAPNVTPDKATGIGNWSAADFTRALRWGIAPDDTHYLPVFPFPYYARLTDADIADLKAFIDTVPAVSTPQPAGPDSIAAISRAQAAIGLALPPATGIWRPDPERDAAWNRGAYLVATVGRCGDCHTQRDVLGRPEQRRYLAGSDGSNGGAKAPNLTADVKTGIGAWSEDDIVHLLTDGTLPDFDTVGGAMGAIVHDTAHLTDADRRAIAHFLASLPPRTFADKN